MLIEGRPSALISVLRPKHDLRDPLAQQEALTPWKLEMQCIWGLLRRWHQGSKGSSKSLKLEKEARKKIESYFQDHSHHWRVLSRVHFTMYKSSHQIIPFPHSPPDSTFFIFFSWGTKNKAMLLASIFQKPELAFPSGDFFLFFFTLFSYLGY